VSRSWLRSARVGTASFKPSGPCYAKSVDTWPDDGSEPDQRALLGLLLDEPLWTLEELRRELAWSAFRVEDALADLTRTGLANQGEGVTWASRAARAAELL
jgi:hypothetical protein